MSRDIMHADKIYEKEIKKTVVFKLKNLHQKQLYSHSPRKTAFSPTLEINVS